MTEPLAAPPFDQITFEDPRVLRLCGDHWRSLGAMPITDAITAGRALDLDSVLAKAIPALNEWARQTATATLDDLAQDLLHSWERVRKPIAKTSRRPATIIRRDSPRAPVAPLTPGALAAVTARLV